VCVLQERELVKWDGGDVEVDSKGVNLEGQTEVAKLAEEAASQATADAAHAAHAAHRCAKSYALMSDTTVQRAKTTENLRSFSNSFNKTGDKKGKVTVQLWRKPSVSAAAQPVSLSCLHGRRTHLHLARRARSTHSPRSSSSTRPRRSLCQ